ncbi:MAG: zinc ribbon domain-containing protein [Pyrinomonadaceae bacterium]|nr:zinc ribbon domain-containing protein [Pyrinomonadaceae bacterium]
MFCPKCGTKNPETGKFCRKCGTDLGTVSDAISGNLPSSKSKSGKRKKKEQNSWEGAMTKLFMGLAFVTVSIILGFSSTGRGWWFWMLIPGFAMLGAGIAQVIQLKQTPPPTQPKEVNNSQSVFEDAEKQSLPPKQTDFVSEEVPGERFQTGEMVPPSVVENTTRHLELDKEGETMTLPEEKV